MFSSLISSSSSFVRLILFAILILTSISLAVEYQYSDEYYYNHLAKALDSKYPEVGVPSSKGPIINDPNLRPEIIFRGLRYPTSMAFLGPKDILVTEKDTGTVRRIVDGMILPQPLLDVNVSTYGHRGMLGIAVDSHPPIPQSKHGNVNSSNNTATYIFLYYTEAPTKDGDDITEEKQPLGNRLYRYELINNKLLNPKLLLDLPATPGAIGNGGKVIVGPNNNVYITVGDVGNGHTTKAQNFQNGSDPDGTGGILRISQDGKALIPGILGNKFPLNLYYSYGMWNSFGIDFDPVTGNLWDYGILKMV